jgi:hypothetical protein
VVAGWTKTAQRSFSQDVDEYVEAFHSMNGFSRQRMEARAAAEFDAALRSMVAPFASNGYVRFNLSTDIVWGRPLRAHSNRGTS